MSMEAAAACIVTDIAYAEPTYVANAASGTGNALTLTGSVAEDLLLLWATADGVTPPSTPGGMTPFGAGITSTIGSSSRSGRLFGKYATTSNETLPANDGGSRTLGLAFRGVDQGLLANLTGRYVYTNTTGGALILPARDLPRAGKVLAFSHRAGTSATPMTDLTELRVGNAANAEVRAAWTPALITPDPLNPDFPGYSYAMSSTQARFTCLVDLLGRELAA